MKITISLILLVSCLYAKIPERTGILEGKVIEYSTKQPLIGANVVIQNTKLGASTDENGKYRIENIPSGIYQVEASMLGYESKPKIDIIIASNRVTQLDYELIDTPIELSRDVHVTAGIFEVDPEKITSTKKLSSAEIKSSPGSGEDVFRVIKSMPGITTASMANANLIVRGGSPDENLALLDNIEIYSPLHFGKVDASMGIISIINPDLLESAEFSSGGFPAEFGGKISSLFELKLKEGNSSYFNTDLNVNMAGFGFYTDGPINNNSNLVFSLRRGIFDLITKMMGRDRAPAYWDVAGKVTYNLGKKNKLSLIGFYYKDDMEKNEIDSASHMNDGRKYKYVKRNGYGTALGVNWYNLFSKGFSLTTLSFSGNGWNAHMGNGIQNDLRGEDLLEKEFSIKNETVYKINNAIEVKGGLFYKSISSDDYAWFEQEVLKSGINLPGDTIDYNPPVSYKAGGFAQTTIKPIRNLFLTAGLRYDNSNITYENNFSPRFSASYKLSDKTSINASGGKYVQDPAPYQIKMEQRLLSLKSSKAWQFVLGIETLVREDIKISAEVYYKDLQRSFVYSDTSRIITDMGSGYSKGIELFFQKKMIDNLLGSVSYSYSISRRRDRADLPLYDYDYDRTHNFTAFGSYRISDNWQAGLKYSFSTGVPYTPPSGTYLKDDKYYIVYGDKNSSRLPDYHELDIRIDRRFYFNNWTLTLYVDLWNVYNRINIVNYDFNTDGKGNINRTDAFDFKIMPIMGVNAQF